MPRRMKWKRDGTSEAPKDIDLRLSGLGRLVVSSGVIHKSAYELRVNAIREAWTLGGVHGQAVRGLALKRFDVSAFMAARQAGTDGIEALLKASGAEPLAAVMRDYLKQSRASDKAKMRQRLMRFAKWLGKAPTVADVTTANVEAFLSSLIDQRTAKTTKAPAAGSTVNRYRAASAKITEGAVDAHAYGGDAYQAFLDNAYEEKVQFFKIQTRIDEINEKIRGRELAILAYNSELKLAR